MKKDTTQPTNTDRQTPNTRTPTPNRDSNTKANRNKQTAIPSILPSLKQRLQTRMAQSKMSLYSIAQHTGLPYSTIWDTANTDKEINTGTIEKIANCLNLSIYLRRKPTPKKEKKANTGKDH